MAKEKLIISTVFVGLTRPPMMMGVTLDYLCLAMMIVLSLTILTNNPICVVLYLPLHLLGWILCKLDPNIFQILLKRADCNYVPNKKIWGCHSYEPF